MKFNIRAYKPSDFKRLYEIDQLCYDADIAYSQRELRGYMRLAGATCVVAEAEGEIAGFCLAAHETGSGYIITIDIIEQYRRHQIGSALLKDIEQRLAKVGTQLIWLETATDNNEAAIAFWQKHGFHKTSVRKGYYPKGRDAFTMVKTVTTPNAPSL